MVELDLALTASERRLLKAYAAYAKVMDERRLAAAAELERLRLTEADRTRTALLAAVSHDLRSPLAAIRAAVDSLRSARSSGPPRTRRSLLDTIDEATTRLTSLVGNLLDMSRIHTGSVTASVTDVDLASASQRLQPIDGGDRIEVAVDADLTVWPIQVCWTACWPTSARTR